MDYRKLYQHALTERYQNPRKKGALSGEHIHTSEKLNPSCGDQVTVFLEVRNGTITQAQYTSSGCVLSTAATDLLMEHVVNMTLAQARALQLHDVQALVQIELGPTREQCILLPLQALQQALFSVPDSHA